VRRSPQAAREAAYPAEHRDGAPVPPGEDALHLLPPPGLDYRGQTLCPFHDDHDPSLGTFEGYDGRTRYKCFACGASGDVIDLVKAVEGVNFNRALYLLNVLEWSTTPEATAFLLALSVVGEGA
jgi:hypothetical protein